MDVYVKPKKVYKAYCKNVIKIKDIADVFSSGGNNDKYNEIILLNITAAKRKNYLISIMDIVKAIMKVDINATVINIGEINCVVQYSGKAQKQNKIIDFLKALAVCIVMFFGASTAIMAFHNDSDVPKLLEGYYEMFYPDDAIPYIMEIPYSLGLAFGIIVFFNHFSKIKISVDPTPIEVQLTAYEKDVIEKQIDILEKEKGE